MHDACECRMAPEVIACDENLGATYDNRVQNASDFYLLS